MPSKEPRLKAFSSGNLRTVGVTGGIGSGKSTVCRILEAEGFPVLFADRMAIEIEENNPAIIRRMKKLLGVEAYTTSGTLDRPYVAKKIFSSKRLQKSVEEAVHPAVFRDLRRRIRQFRIRGAKHVVIEAALIFESGMDKLLDLVVVVDADEYIRISRVMKRDGVSREEVRGRMSAQWPMERKIRLADIVIGNNGSKEELLHKVQLLKTILHQQS